MLEGSGFWGPWTYRRATAGVIDEGVSSWGHYKEDRYPSVLHGLLPGAGGVGMRGRQPLSDLNPSLHKNQLLPNTREHKKSPGKHS